MEQSSSGMPVSSERSNRRRVILIIIGVVAVLIVVIAGAYVWLHPFSKTPKSEPAAGISLEFVGATTNAWYLFSDNTLRPISAPAGAKSSDGSARTLGTLPDGSLLTFMPEGLTHVALDGTQIHLFSAGPVGSSTPMAVASADLSLIAFENQVTHVIDVYHFNPTSTIATYLGSARAPSTLLTPVKLSDDFLAGVATTTDGRLTKESVERVNEEMTFLTARAQFENESAARPQAVAIADDLVIIETLSGAFYEYHISPDREVGEAISVSTVVTK